MNLDELLREAGPELDRLTDAHETTCPYVISTSPRRHHALVRLTAAVLVATIVGVIAVRVRARDNRSTAAPQPAVVDTGQRTLLLPPASLPGLKIVQTHRTSSIGGGMAGTVRSPSGSVYGISVLGNFWGALPSSLEQRRIGASMVGSGMEMEQRAYSIVDACTMVGVSEEGPLNAWGLAVTALLEGTTVTGSSVHVTLPSGWSSLGAGPIGDELSLNFSTSVAERDVQFDLFQMPAASVGALLAGHSRDATEQTVLDGHVAWLMHSQDGTSTTRLSWQHDGTAELLVGRNITDADLKQVARSLAPATLAAWNAITPPDAPGPTVSPASTVPSPAGCATHDLRITLAG